MFKQLFWFLFIISLNAGTFWLFANKLFPEDFIITGNLGGFVLAGGLFAFLNWFMRPLLKIITIPLRLLTFGLINFIINAIILYLLENVYNFIEIGGYSLEIKDWTVYLVGGFLLALLNWLLHSVKK